MTTFVAALLCVCMFPALADAKQRAWFEPNYLSSQTTFGDLFKYTTEIDGRVILFASGKTNIGLDIACIAEDSLATSILQT
eukprot:1510399-Rhodomonas_salina.1